MRRGIKIFDPNSDPYDCFGISTDIKVDGVRFTDEGVYGRNLKEIQAAFKRIRLTGFDPDDI